MKPLIAWAGRLLSFFIFHSPRFIRQAIAGFLAFLWFDLFRIRRDVVLNNIEIAFPEMSYRERVRLGRKSLRHLALNAVEYSFLPWLNRKNYEDHFEFHGTEILEDALKRGHGVLILTCHLGHGDMACAGLSLRGYPIVMVSKFFKVKWLNDLWFGMRERLGTKFVPPRDSSYALLKALKRGSATIIPLDQFTGPPIGVRTTFFGRETGTAAGLSVMAERSKAPVISAYTVRLPNGKHAIYFLREMPVRLSDDETAEQITQRFNDELESMIRLEPSQWMWIHKRWKKFKY